MTPWRITLVEAPACVKVIRRMSDEDGRRQLAEAHLPLSVMMATDAALSAGAHLTIERTRFDSGGTATAIRIHSASRRLREPLLGVGFRRRRNQYFWSGPYHEATR